MPNDYRYCSCWRTKLSKSKQKRTRCLSFVRARGSHKIWWHSKWHVDSGFVCRLRFKTVQQPTVHTWIVQLVLLMIAVILECINPRRKWQACWEQCQIIRKPFEIIEWYGMWESDESEGGREREHQQLVAIISAVSSDIIILNRQPIWADHVDIEIINLKKKKKWLYEEKPATSLTIQYTPIDFFFASLIESKHTWSPLHTIPIRRVVLLCVCVCMCCVCVFSPHQFVPHANHYCKKNINLLKVLRLLKDTYSCCRSSNGRGRKKI